MIIDSFNLTVPPEPSFTYYVNTPTTWSYTWTQYQDRYMYQIFCPKPRCKGKMWAEIDQLVICSKCTSSIKVVQQEPDYTVAIDD
jgi:hypothetical protein